MSTQFEFSPVENSAGMPVLYRRRLLFLLLLLVRRRKVARWKRRLWVREIFQSRATRGEYHALISEMRLSDHESFYRYFHMTPERFSLLLREVGPSITYHDTNFRRAISPGERLAITLRFLVTGDAMQTISFSYRVGLSTVAGIINQTCEALWSVLQPEYMPRPSNSSQWRCISEGFKQIWNFPHCVGAIDGKHVVMQAPARSGSTFFNYKGTHSIILMAVCDANYCFTLIDVGDAGRHSDGGVLSNSVFGQAMENNELSLPEDSEIDGISSPIPYFFVGDAAFPLKMYMLRPFPGKFLPEDKRVFNYRLSRARRIIENTFGIMATKFRIFRRPLIANPDKVTRITKAACCLHNYLKITEASTSASSRPYCPPGYVDREDKDGIIVPGDWRHEVSEGITSMSRLGSNTYSRSAAELRDAMKNYFMSPQGSLEWQLNHIRSS